MHREPQDLFDGTIVFAFGDLNKQDEFLRCVSVFDAHHIVMLSGWSCMGAMSVYSIREAANASFRPSCFWIPGSRRLPSARLRPYGMP